MCSDCLSRAILIVGTGAFLTIAVPSWSQEGELGAGVEAQIAEVQVFERFLREAEARRLKGECVAINVIGLELSFRLGGRYPSGGGPRTGHVNLPAHVQEDLTRRFMEIARRECPPGSGVDISGQPVARASPDQAPGTLDTMGPAEPAPEGFRSSGSSVGVRSNSPGPPPPGGDTPSAPGGSPTPSGTPRPDSTEASDPDGFESILDEIEETLQPLEADPARLRGRMDAARSMCQREHFEELKRQLIARLDQLFRAATDEFTKGRLERERELAEAAVFPDPCPPRAGAALPGPSTTPGAGSESTGSVGHGSGGSPPLPAPPPVAAPASTGAANTAIGGTGSGASAPTPAPAPQPPPARADRSSLIGARANLRIAAERCDPLAYGRAKQRLLALLDALISEESHKERREALQNERDVLRNSMVPICGPEPAESWSVGSTGLTDTTERRAARLEAIDRLRTGQASSSGTEVIPSLRGTDPDPAARVRADARARMIEAERNARREHTHSAAPSEISGVYPAASSTQPIAAAESHGALDASGALQGALQDRSSPEAIPPTPPREAAAAALAPASEPPLAMIPPAGPPPQVISPAAVPPALAAATVAPPPPPAQGIAGSYRLADTSSGVSQVTITELGGRLTLTGMGPAIVLEQDGDNYFGEGAVLFGQGDHQIRLNRRGSSWELLAQHSGGGSFTTRLVR
jgi:hypothetical protein